MPLSILFYVLLLLFALFGVWVDYPLGPRPIGRGLLLFLLLLVLGWHSFGSPIK